MLKETYEIFIRLGQKQDSFSEQIFTLKGVSEPRRWGFHKSRGIG